MLRITSVLETEKIVEYLKSRGLLSQYKKVKNYILQGSFKQVDLKKREPKLEQVYAFRINKQFRAIGYIDGSLFKITHIDNHQ